MPTPILMSWSSGKDSAWALHELRQRSDVEVVALFTTYSSNDRRVPIQYTRIELVLAQARALGLPLVAAPLPNPCSVVAYESAVNAAMEDAKADHFAEGIAFADIHLEDIRKYREQLYEVIGLTCHFPLWGRTSLELAQTMIEAGHKSWVTAVDTVRLPASFCGRPLTRSFSPICRRASMLAASMASSTRCAMAARSSDGTCSLCGVRRWCRTPMPIRTSCLEIWRSGSKTSICRRRTPPSSI